MSIADEQGLPTSDFVLLPNYFPAQNNSFSSARVLAYFLISDFLPLLTFLTS